MRVLTPIDGSDCSLRAVAFAADFASKFGGTVDVIHFADYRTDSTEAILDQARAVLADTDIDAEPEVISEPKLANPRYANRIGRDILRYADDNGFDHIVMGHHGTGRIGTALLGSAAETVVEATEYPTTVIP